jgi:hypothetical protein
MSARRLITPDEFFSAWLRAVSQIDGGACRSMGRPALTALMKPLIEDTGRLLEFKTRTEYHDLDVVFFEDEDGKHFAHRKPPKYLSAAIEHENRLEMTAEEMNKLQRTDTPLRVLIAYARDSWSKAEAYISNYLRTYEEIIRDGDWANDTATRCRQLVIFGNAYEQPFGWRGYVYEVGGFRLLSAGEAI